MLHELFLPNLSIGKVEILPLLLLLKPLSHMTQLKNSLRPISLGCADLFEEDWIYHNSVCPFSVEDYEQFKQQFHIL